MIAEATLDALGWTLVHFLWQGALAAALLELALLTLRRGSSQVRYGVRCLALAAMGVAPLLTFWVLRSAGRGGVLEAGGRWTLGLEVSAAVPLVPAWVVPLWGAGAAFFGLRLLAGYLRVRRVSRPGVGRPLPAPWRERFEHLAGTLAVRAAARVVDSAALAAPAVVGFLKPVVLIPARVLTGLGEEQIVALLVHELAHVRRFDYLVNLLQSVLEALLFYHPAVWWVSAGIRTEREYCCDDVAVALGADGVAYARALTELEVWRGAELSIGMSTRGGSLMHRIQRLVGIHHSPGARGAVHALGALVIAACMGATALGLTSGQDAADGQDLEEFKRPRALPVQDGQDGQDGQDERGAERLKERIHAALRAAGIGDADHVKKVLEALRAHGVHLDAEHLRKLKEHLHAAQEGQGAARDVLRKLQEHGVHLDADHLRKLKEHLHAAQEGQGTAQGAPRRLQEHGLPQLDLDHTRKLLEHVHEALEAHGVQDVLKKLHEHGLPQLDRHHTRKLLEHVHEVLEAHGVQDVLKKLHENGLPHLDADHARKLKEHLHEALESHGLTPKAPEAPRGRGIHLGHEHAQRLKERLHEVLGRGDLHEALQLQGRLSGDVLERLGEHGIPHLSDEHAQRLKERVHEALSRGDLHDVLQLQGRLSDDVLERLGEHGIPHLSDEHAQRLKERVHEALSRGDLHDVLQLQGRLSDDVLERLGEHGIPHLGDEHAQRLKERVREALSRGDLHDVLQLQGRLSGDVLKKLKERGIQHLTDEQVKGLKERARQALESHEAPPADWKERVRRALEEAGVDAKLRRKVLERLDARSGAIQI